MKKTKNKSSSQDQASYEIRAVQVAGHRQDTDYYVWSFLEPDERFPHPKQTTQSSRFSNLPKHGPNQLSGSVYTLLIICLILGCWIDASSLRVHLHKSNSGFREWNRHGISITLNLTISSTFLRKWIHIHCGWKAKCQVLMTCARTLLFFIVVSYIR